MPYSFAPQRACLFWICIRCKTPPVRRQYFKVWLTFCAFCRMRDATVIINPRRALVFAERNDLVVQFRFICHSVSSINNALCALSKNVRIASLRAFAGVLKIHYLTGCVIARTTE